MLGLQSVQSGQVNKKFELGILKKKKKKDQRIRKMTRFWVS